MEKHVRKYLLSTVLQRLHYCRRRQCHSGQSEHYQTCPQPFLVSANTVSVKTTEAQAIRLSESIADVEYALRTHRTFKRMFSKWLKLHIVISAVLYLLLVLHVFAEFYYGLRWLS